jgi:hypothetical protein
MLIYYSMRKTILTFWDIFCSPVNIGVDGADASFLSDAAPYGVGPVKMGVT